jgi:hypothetical protein
MSTEPTETAPPAVDGVYKQDLIVTVTRTEEMHLPPEGRLTPEIVEAVQQLGYHVESVFFSSLDAEYEYMGLCEECGRVLLDCDAFTRDPDSDVVWCDGCFDALSDSEEAPQCP